MYAHPVSSMPSYRVWCLPLSSTTNNKTDEKQDTHVESAVTFEHYVLQLKMPEKCSY